MIVHDFKCNICGHIMEDVSVRGHDDAPLCTECFSTDVKRIYRSVPPLVGYETPYRTLEKKGIPDKPIVSGKYYRSK
jgi:hypothetical protein